MSNEIQPINQGAITLDQQTDNLLQDAIVIIESAQHTAYQSVNEVLIKRNWLLGLRIN